MTNDNEYGTQNKKVREYALDLLSQNASEKNQSSAGGFSETDKTSQSHGTPGLVDDQLKLAVLLSWHGMSVTTSKGRKLLQGPNHGVVRGGEVLALMGLSGGGKSTLLNALVSGAQPENPVALGKRCSMEGTVKTAPGLRVGYSPDQQHTVMLEDLTVREWLQFRVLVGIPNMNTAELDLHVDGIAKSVGLVGEVLETRIAVISAGQRVRTTIAAEIAILTCGQQDNRAPQVLILDEPLSALDSATSLQLMGTIRDVVVGTNKAVIMSLHQPRPEVYMMCDTILLLSKGHHVYFGPRVDAVSTVRRHASALSGSTRTSMLETSTFVDEDDSYGDRGAHYLLDAMVVSSLSPSEIAKSIREEKRTEKTESEEVSSEDDTADHHDLTSTTGNSYVWYRARTLLVLIFRILSRRWKEVFRFFFSMGLVYLLLGAIGWQIGETYGTAYMVASLYTIQHFFILEEMPSITVFYLVVANDIFCNRQSKAATAIVCFLMAFLQAIVTSALSLVPYIMGSLSGGKQLAVYVLCIVGLATYLNVFLYASIATFARRDRAYIEVLQPAQSAAILTPMLFDAMSGLFIPFSIMAEPFLGFSLVNPLGSAVRAVMRTRKDIIAPDEPAVASLVQDALSSEPGLGCDEYKTLFEALADDDDRDNLIEKFIFELFGVQYSTGVYLSILLGYVVSIMILFCVALWVNSRRRSATTVRMSVIVPRILLLIFVSVLIYVGVVKVAPIRDDKSTFQL